MKSYLDIVRRVLDKGYLKKNRTGVDALTIPFVHFEHEMSEGFPLLTTKKMGMKNIAVELEGFLRGITSKKWFQERGCTIWDEWANPMVVAQGLLDAKGADEAVIRKDLQQRLDDLGPIYGYQWRRYGLQYPPFLENSVANGDQNGVAFKDESDQFKTILTKLVQNPTDRRMVCCAWNPNQAHLQALPPCHILWNVVVINDTLNLGWYQRSCDLMLGVPYNIASYALLMKLLCKYSGLKEGVLSGTLADCHIYENHVDGAKEQISRESKSLPSLQITADQPFDLVAKELDHVKWTHKDFELTNYNPDPAIKFEIAI
jgi:thymidylate synthase